MIDKLSLRSRFGMIIAIIIWALIAFTIVIALIQGFGSAPVWMTIFLLLAFAVLMFGMYWNPRVEFTTDYVRVVNLINDWRISYAAIASISTKFALTIQTTDNRKIVAWAAPAPSRYSSFGLSKTEVQHLPETTYIDDTVRPGDIPTSDSGSAASILRLNWETFNKSGANGIAAVSRRYILVWPIAFIALLIAGLLVG